MHVRMSARAGRRIAVLAMAAVIAAGLGGCGGDDDSPTSARADAAFLLEPAATGGPHGAAHLVQDGTHLTGWIAVWGLAPGSVHPNHLHANPDGESAASCPDRPTDRHAIDFEPLRADSSGVAFRRIDIAVGEDVVRPGVYWMIHKDAAEAAAGGSRDLACGNVVTRDG